jgi:amino acid adenylation domain-containing protein/non-ribosomal peptide synthase protein (TIGR01720 family)
MDIKQNVAAIYPLTPLQQGLLFHTEAEADGAYVVQTAYELRGKVNESMFKKAWQLTIARHPVLRSLFGGLTTHKPVQVILKDAKLSWSAYDWKNYSSQVCESRFKDLTEAERKTGFTMDRPPLMRFYWLQLESDVVRFVWTYHHALLDGWSVPLVLRDVINCYDALSKGLNPQLPVPTEYRNYISWLKRQSSQQATHYWKNLLSNCTEPTQLNLSPPTTESDRPVSELEVSFDKDITAALKAFCQKHRLTLNLLCQAGLAILMERYSGSNDIVFGTTVSGRPSEISDINQMIGSFINTLPVKAHVNSDKSVLSLLEDLRNQQLERDQYSFLPLREIQRCSRKSDGSPLFNTLFVFENFPVDPSIKQTISELEITRVLLEDKTSYPLTIAAKATDVLTFNVQFKTSEYHQKDIKNLTANYQFILQQMVSNPQSNINELATLQETQRQKLLSMGQGNCHESSIASVITRFDEVVNNQPDKVAIVDNDEQYTYRELQQKANQLTNWLKQQGIGKDQRVAICLPSGIRFFVSMLAILKANASYVPIEITQPEERINTLLNEAKVALVITDGTTKWQQTFDWSKQESTLSEQTFVENEATNVCSESIAYIMFTSGTTGKPKAISIRQDSLANHIDDAITRYSFNSNDRILQFSSLGFDISVEEIWGSLCSGATLVVHDRKDLALDSFENMIAEKNITTLDLPTAYWHTWVGTKLSIEKLKTLKKIIVGGEAARSQALRTWRDLLPNVQWFNTYGPTETTIVATVWQAPEKNNIPDLIPIGSPIQNVSCLVLDEQQRLTPPGVVGELYIGGIGLSPGYFCRPDFDADAFINKTINGKVYRLYRTGDRVHWNLDGQLMFHGRRDNQIKLRGYRIELSAVENELSQCQGVNQAHAAIQKRDHHPVLVAYVTVDLTSKVTSQEILDELRQRLPGYMVPSALVLMETLPLTANGKIATSQLQPIELQSANTEKSPPTTNIQKQLATYWQEVLGNKINSIHSNFFELGGDSIHAIKIASLAKQGGLSLQIQQLFESPTIYQLAALLQSKQTTLKKRDFMVGQQPLSLWQNWLFNQQLIELSNPQFLCVKSPRLLTKSQVSDALKIVIQNNECLRSEFVSEANKIIHRVNPWSDITSYKEISSSEPLNKQQLHQQLKSFKEELKDQSGTHVLNIKGDKTSDSLLMLLVYGCHIDELSQTHIQQQINSAIEGQYDTKTNVVDTGLMQKQFRKTVNSKYFDSDIEFWKNKQQNKGLFETDQLDHNTLKATVCLSRKQLEKLSHLNYISEEEVLAYLVTSALSKFLSLETVPCHVLRSTRDDALWKGKAAHATGDFRTIFPCPIELISHTNSPSSIKSFKQQFRDMIAKSLAYIVSQHSNKLPSPHLRKSLLICLADLELSDQPCAIEQLSNGIGDKNFGGKVRFIKTAEEVQLIWQVQNSQINESGIKELAELTHKTAQMMGKTSINNEITPVISSDFKHCPLDEKSVQTLWTELATENKTIGIDAIYPVTPLQRGMLFHSITNQDGAYLVQAVYQLKGDLDRRKLRQAWQVALARHPMLRSFFWGIDSETPVQVILKHMDLNWNDENWMDVDETEFNQRLKALTEAELRVGFDNNHKPLMRMYCIRNAKNRYQFIWTYHHALLDGWSVPLVLRDVLEQYAALVENRNAKLSPVSNYNAYAQWLQNKSSHSSIEYWQKELNGFLTPTNLKLPHNKTKSTSVKEVKASIDNEMWQKLIQFCQLQQITPNVACQTAWALLLNQYSSDNDVLFGTTVSGRSTEITGINNLVGAFINTIPVRVNLKGLETVNQVLKDVRQQQLEREEHCYLPLWEIQRICEVEAGGSLFDSLLVYENYPIDPNVKQGAGNIEIEPVSGHGDSNYPLTIILIPGQKLDIRLRYRNISKEIAQGLVENFTLILNRMCQFNSLLSDIQIKLPSQTMATSYLAGPAGTKLQKTVPELFLESVAKNKEAPAIIEAGNTLTYSQLDKRANALAQLLQTQGVTEKDVVALKLPRGIQAIVSIVAIQKLGATYLPLDLTAPKNRLEQMLLASSCRILISNLQHNPKIKHVEKLILLDADDVKHELLAMDANFTHSDIGLDHPIYINFTSGTQGKPKGVVIPQRAISRLVCTPEYVKLNSSTVMLHASALAFDAATFEIWGALLNGGCLIAYSEEHMDLSKLNQHIQKYNVNTMWLTAGLFQQWVNTLQTTVIPELDYILTGGDVVSPIAVKNLYDKFSNTTVINGYGPTETTTFACCYPIPRGHDWRQAIPIGNPINSTQIKVVDESLNTLAQGKAGELLISGHGLALGYLGDHQLNSEKFIELDGQKYFRTGDKVQMACAGIEFISRIDRQVKIRGFRIELNEIEIVIRQQINNECIVVAQGESADSKKLYAFIEAKSEAHQESQILTHIQQHLPSYMVPARIVFLDQFPLTKNGKVDQQRLPQIHDVFSSKELTSNDCINVENPDQILMNIKNIWSNLLAINSSKISDDSHFFESGGDSIVAIQLVAKASEIGIALSVQQIFKKPVLKDMASNATPANNKQELDGKHHGNIDLSPIQHWFFEHFSDYPNHWNQSVLLTVPKDLNLKKMGKAIHSLSQHHDLLRARFTQQNNTWQQFITPWDPQYDIKEVSLVDNTENWQQQLELICHSEQQSLDISKGKLLQLVHFKLPENESNDRLHIICHHLIVDGVSWRILLSDLMKAYRGSSRLSKTHSYRQWGKTLISRMPEFKKELGFWQQQCLPTNAHLHCDLSLPNVIADEQKVACQLSTQETQKLLYSTPLAYNNSVEHTILTATLLALSEWNNSESIRIDMEGHGRNGHADQLDLSNTLGWFTAIYPVRFSSIQKNDLVETLKTVKEQMKSIPQGGVGFGILKYLSKDSDVICQLQDENKNPISFNYMGQMRTDQDSEFGIATESAGLGNDPRQKRSHILAFGGIIEKERLKLHCHYSEKLHTQQQVQQLLDNITQKLRELIMHCETNPYAGATPSDFPEYPRIQQHELDQLWQFAQATPERGRIQAIGQLTGPQQGMIHHSQMNTQEALYVEQLSYRISGPLDAEKLKMAWQKVINNHDIFRVEFLGLDTANPYQVIREYADLNWIETDLRSLDTTDQVRKFEQLINQDRTQHFNFQKAPLMRLRLCIESQSSAILTWTYHHALMDGWSMPLVFKSLFNAYKDTLDEPETSKTGPSFRRYLHWLSEQDKTIAKKFWRESLKGFTSPTPLIVKKDTTHSDLTGADEISRKLDGSVYDKLQTLCKKHGVTLNSICQTAWAALLARYSGEQDVLFAITSSGRPGDIEGINDIVGPFINTLPARIKISKEMELGELLSHVHMQQASRDNFGYLALTDIQSESEVPNGVNLFESIFAFENYPIDDAISENQLPITFKPLDWTSQTNFPLTVIWAPGETLKVKIQFAKQHFDLATVNRLTDHYISIIEAMARGKHPLEVNMLSEVEQQQMLKWNKTDQPYDTEQCIHQMISNQARKTPDATALYYKQERISYKMLEQKSSALAYTLHSQNLAHTDSLISVCLPRGIDQVIACLGIMKAGGAYLPLDPKWPIERRQKLIKKGRATAVIATQKIKQELNTDLTVIDPAQVPPFAPDMTFNVDVSPNNLAYVIFTSGSTGEPKGVMIEHRSAVNTFIDINTRFNVSSVDRVLAVSALTFDLSVYDLFGVLCCGAAAVLPSDSEATNSQSWARLVEQHKVTIWDSVPQLMNILLEEAEADKEINIKSLRTIMMSGDWIPLDLPQRIKDHLPSASINSLGGATEGSIWSITYPIENLDPQWKSIPYGKPMANQQFHIVDDQDQPCPIGVPGHLYIGGLGVARGYWADPERTALQFRPHPKTGKPIYWTGDLARYGDDGTIEFLGRSDFQVKINGFRIELGEIETALNQLDSIIRSVVIAFDSDENKKSLIAYVIAEPENFDESQCLQYLQVKLPRYMVPSAIIRLDKIPLSSNGKVNRKALPKPSEDQLSSEYIAPQSATEITISETWKALLKCKQVGINDNFFDLGGHSLLATQMVSRLARTLNIEVPMELVFRMPTVKSLAIKIDELLASNVIEGDFEEGEL